MGVRAWVADKWGRFVAYVRSVPPHIWLGLAIAAVTLIIIYLSWRKSNNNTQNQGIDPATGISVTPTDSGASGVSLPTAQPLTLPQPVFTWNPNKIVVATPAQPTGYTPLGEAYTPVIEGAQTAKIPTTYNYTAEPAIAPAPIGEVKTNWTAPIQTASSIAIAPIAGLPGGLPGDTRTELQAATTPVYHPATILSQAFIPVKTARNEVGIY